MIKGKNYWKVRSSASLYIYFEEYFQGVIKKNAWLLVSLRPNSYLYFVTSNEKLMSKPRLVTLASNFVQFVVCVIPTDILKLNNKQGHPS